MGKPIVFSFNKWKNTDRQIQFFKTRFLVHFMVLSLTLSTSEAERRSKLTVRELELLQNLYYAAFWGGGATVVALSPWDGTPLIILKAQ